MINLLHCGIFFIKWIAVPCPRTTTAERLEPVPCARTARPTANRASLSLSRWEPGDLSKPGTARWRMRRECPRAWESIPSTWPDSFHLWVSPFLCLRRSTAMPTSQAWCRIKGRLALGPSQLLGTKALSNCKMFGSASPAWEKGAPTGLKESITHRQGETHGRAEPITFITMAPKWGESNKEAKELWSQKNKKRTNQWAAKKRWTSWFQNNLWRLYARN